MKICLCPATVKVLFAHLRRSKAGKGIIRMIKARDILRKPKRKATKTKGKTKTKRKGSKKRAGSTGFITVKMPNGKTRRQKYKVLKNGKFKFIKNR